VVRDERTVGGATARRAPGARSREGARPLKPVERLKRWAGRLKAEVYALYLAYRDPRVPLHARVFAAVVVGYAFSPIDLFPDPIPVLGYLDDLVLIPIGIALAIRMIPTPVLTNCREKAPGYRGETD
jgi:uncharacterized membrane protein YkvA (DUF1232 family)